MPPDAEIRLPADSAYVTVLRTSTAGIAARLDFTLDDIEDLRMAVGEASTILLAKARPGGTMIARYFLSDGRVEMHLSADAVSPSPPEPSSFAWQVLTSTASDVRAEVSDDVLTLVLAVTSTNASTAT